MDFLANLGIGSTPTGKAVEKATSELLIGPDWGANMEIVDLINTQEDAPEHAAKALRRRLKHDNERVVLLALTLLETCVKNCAAEFHRFIATRDFMKEMSARARSRNLEVRDKALELVQQWAIGFRQYQSHYPLFQDAFERLRREPGVVFPPPEEGTAAPVFDPPPDVAAAGVPYGVGAGAGMGMGAPRDNVLVYGADPALQQRPVMYVDADGQPVTVMQQVPGVGAFAGAHGAAPAASQAQSVADRAAAAAAAAAEDFAAHESEVEKLHSDLQIVSARTEVLVNILQGQGDESELRDVVGFLEACKPRLLALIEAGLTGSLSEEMLGLVFQVNDNVQRALERERNAVGFGEGDLLGTSPSESEGAAAAAEADDEFASLARRGSGSAPAPAAIAPPPADLLVSSVAASGQAPAAAADPFVLPAPPMQPLQPQAVLASAQQSTSAAPQPATGAPPAAVLQASLEAPMVPSLAPAPLQAPMVPAPAAPPAAVLQASLEAPMMPSPAPAPAQAAAPPAAVLQASLEAPSTNLSAAEMADFLDSEFGSGVAPPPAPAAANPVTADDDFDQFLQERTGK